MFSLLSQSLTAIKRQSSKLFSASKLFSSSKLFSTQFFSARGFSIVGVMVIGSMGLITMLGLAKMLSNLNEDMADFKKSSSTHTSLVSQIDGLLASHCQEILIHSIKPEELQKGGAGTSNTDPIEFSVLQYKKSQTSTTEKMKMIIDTQINPDSETDATKKAKIEKNKEKLKKLYGIEGHSRFQLTCKSSPNCKCPTTRAPGPASWNCTKNWNLSLFTMNYKNNLPLYKEILNQDLEIAYRDPNSDRTIDATEFSCRIPTLTTSDRSNTFYGTNAGISTTTGTNNSFYGFNAGKSNTTGENNSFFGANAGESNTTGKNNSFFGANAGNKNTTGSNNSFFGYNAGLNNTTGSNNSFLGSEAGNKNTTGSNNSFFGYNAGLNNTTGSNNSFLGSEAGNKNTIGSNRLNIANVIYGTVGTTDNNKYPSNRGIDIHGKLEVCDKNGSPNSCKEVCTNPSDCPPQNSPSSREYKKNIVPFKKEQKALSALVKTPLFTYQYKEDYPEKQRMGVISEELPKALQLPARLGKPILPDWSSIYGYLWAGIKALHASILDLEEFLQLGESFKKIFQEELQTVKEPLQKNIYSLKRENQNLREKLEEREKSNRLLYINIQQAKQKSADLKQEMTLIKKQEDNFKEELKKLKQNIKE